MGVLDLLFPKFCVNCKAFGAYLCANCFSYISFDTHSRCVLCQKQTLDGKTHPTCTKKYALDGVFAALVYKSVVKKLIYQFKYRPYLTDLQHVLVELFVDSLLQKEVCFQIMAQKPLLVPIPLHKSKLKKRGYNQAQLLAKGLSKQLQLSMAEVLERHKETLSQVGLSQKDRKANVADAFVLKKEMTTVITGKVVLLVDDVVTTGATFLAAAQILKKQGAKAVWGIALAQEE